MKLQKTISNVKWVASSTGIFMHNSLHEVYDPDGAMVLNSVVQLQEIIFEKPYFFINDIEGNSYLIEDKIQFFKDTYIKKVLNDRYLLVSHNGETKIYDIPSRSFEDLLKYKIFKFFVVDNNLYLSKNNILAYSIKEQHQLWQFDLTEFGVFKPIFVGEHERKPYQVAKFLGVWNEELLVACDGGLILALSLVDGQVIRKWDVLPEDAEESIRTAFHGLLHQSGNVFQLGMTGDVIFALYYSHWVEICLKTGIIKTKHLTSTFDQHLISAFQTKSGYAEDETHLYTTVVLDQRKLDLNYMPTAICALNKQTSEIDWLYRFDKDNSADYVSVQVPQVANNKLFQLTQNKVLHIFEKEPL